MADARVHPDRPERPGPHRRGSAKLIVVMGLMCFSIATVAYLMMVPVPSPTLPDEDEERASDAIAELSDSESLIPPPLETDGPPPRIDARTAQTRMGQIDEYLRVGDFNNAWTAARSLEPSLMNHLGLQVRLARCELSFSELPAAEARLERVLSIDPDHGPALRYLGITCRRLGKLVESERHIRRATQRIPDAHGIFFDYALTLCLQREYQEAIIQFQKGDARGDTPSVAHNDWGTALFNLQQFQNAAFHYEQAIGLEPDNPDFHHNYGTALERLDRLSEAVAQYNQALLLDPNHRAKDRLAELAQAGLIDKG